MNNSIFLLAGILCLFNTSLRAQYENVWVYGTQRGVNFNSGVPVPITTAIDGFGEANASICDENGFLLFYTEGSHVWDRDGNLMPNGSSLTGLTYDSRPATTSSAQGTVIVPVPDSIHKYYVFSMTSNELAVNAGRLYYSVVDMRLNNGLGDIVPGQKGILLDSNCTEAVTAVTGERCNIWLLAISRRGHPLSIKAFEINGYGISRAAVLSPISGLSQSMINLSPDRRKILLNAGVFSFDPATGKVMEQLLKLEAGTTPSGAGCFSPDNSKLYVNSRDQIYQYDLSLNDPGLIAASRTTIGPIGNLSYLKLGPDGKIYFHPSHDNQRLSRLGCINRPDLAGTACEYMAEALTFSDRRYNHALPNVVPIIRKDTILSNQNVSGPCFANAGNMIIQAKETRGWDYIWNDSITGLSRAVDSPGIYWITYYTPPCVYHVDTFQVSFPNGILPKIHTEAACKHNNNGKAYAYTYWGDTVTYSYFWKDANGRTVSVSDTLRQVSSGRYTLHVQTANCDTSLALFIPEEDYKVSFSADSIVCQGKEVIFRNTSDSHFRDLSWYFGDGSSSFLENPGYVYPHADHYSVMLVGKGSICTDTAYQDIVVDSITAVSFHVDKPAICIGEHLTFIPKADFLTLAELRWQMGDGHIFSTLEEEVSHAYDISGVHEIVLHALFRACPDTSYTDTVHVYALPFVDLGSDSFLCLEGKVITLKNLDNTSSGRLSYLWNTGDTTEEIEVKKAGIYSLRVRSEPLGCSTTEVITVKKDCYMDIPNAFTPNGDGHNDYFFPRQLLGQNVTYFNMQVFNRWGKVVFETNSTEGRGWDGKLNGKEQPSDVYIYYMEVAPANGHRETYKGNVTLIR